MPILTGRPAEATPADLATRLSALRLPAGSRVGGWLPEQATTVAEAADSPADLLVTPPVAPQVIPLVAPAAPPIAPLSIGALLGAAIEDRLPLWAHDVLSRIGRRGVFTVGVVVLLLAGLGGVALVHHRSSPGSSSYAGSSWPGSASTSVGGATATSPSASAGVTPSTTPAGSIVVDVAGTVHKPGLVTLPPGSRVADAIAAAGGPLRRKDVATTDLAAKVGDGQLVLVGPTGSGAATGVGGTSGETGTSTADGGTAGPVISTLPTWSPSRPCPVSAR
jgi:competence protein ComEA